MIVKRIYLYIYIYTYTYIYIYIYVYDGSLLNTLRLLQALRMMAGLSDWIQDNASTADKGSLPVVGRAGSGSPTLGGVTRP